MVSSIKPWACPAKSSTPRAHDDGFGSEWPRQEPSAHSTQNAHGVPRKEGGSLREQWRTSVRTPTRRPCSGTAPTSGKNEQPLFSLSGFASQVAALVLVFEKC